MHKWLRRTLNLRSQLESRQTGNASAQLAMLAAGRVNPECLIVVSHWVATNASLPIVRAALYRARPLLTISNSSCLTLFFPQSYIPYIYWLVFSASTHTTKLYVRNLFLLNLSKLYMNEGFFAVVLILHVTSCSILW